MINMPTGSTTAAFILFLQTVTNLVLHDPFVSVIALDFSTVLIPSVIQL